MGGPGGVAFGSGRQLAERYPDDPDAAALYAESRMNLRPWKLWSPDGKPAAGTGELVRVLESVLRRHPAPTTITSTPLRPPRIRNGRYPSARRLATLVPAAGHLVHMPAHVSMRVGDYEAAARANEQAIAVDRAYLKASGAKGVYPLMYFSHNIHFLAVARATQGRFADAKKAADDLVAHVGPHVKDMPMLEGFLPTPTLVLVRFRRWDEVLSAPRPDPKLLVTTGADLLWDIPAESLNDDRLGRALDAFFTQRHSILAAVAAETLRRAELSPRRLHFDPTHLIFYGAYEASQPRPGDTPWPPRAAADVPPARITHGYAADEKPIHVGITAAVDDLGALPILGQCLDGNDNNHTAIRQQTEWLLDLGLITRESSVARSVRVSIPEAEIRSLEDAQAPP